MVNKDIFAKRLHELMNYYEISASTLADSIGVQRSSISHILAGRNKPSLDFVLKILDNYKAVTFDWLIKGEGTLSEIQPSNTNNTSAPTLFDTIIPENKSKSDDIAYSQEISNNDNPLTNKENTIDRIVIFYSNGTFKSYHTKQ